MAGTMPTEAAVAVTAVTMVPTVAVAAAVMHDGGGLSPSLWFVMHAVCVCASEPS